MAITIPTVDEFTESTVMLVIREIAEYICGDNGLVAQINNNDITGFKSSYTNNILKIDATKGDGSTLPVCNVTIEGGGSSTGNPYPTAVSGTVGVDGNITFTITMSSGSPLTTTINMNYFASTADLSDLQEQVTGIKPTVTTNLESSPPTITVSVNGTSSTANLPISTPTEIDTDYIFVVNNEYASTATYIINMLNADSSEPPIATCSYFVREFNEKSMYSNESNVISATENVDPIFKYNDFAKFDNQSIFKINANTSIPIFSDATNYKKCTLNIVSLTDNNTPYTGEVTIKNAMLPMSPYKQYFDIKATYNEGILTSCTVLNDIYITSNRQPAIFSYKSLIIKE